MVFRESDSSPKEEHFYHAAGLDGQGGSSYIDAEVLRDKDSNSGWTSAADGTLEQRYDKCETVPILSDGASWRAILQQPEDQLASTRLLRSTFNGRPLGSDRFIAKLESMLNRRLRAPKLDRPRRAAASRRGRNAKQGTHLQKD